MLSGLRTVIYPVTDLDRAKQWYGQVFSATPYFDQPFYVGFSIAGFELGLVPDGTPGSQGSITYWGVDDIESELARIVGLGGSVHGPVQEVGGGIRTAELADPFGNLLGLIDNPHFDATAVR